LVEFVPPIHRAILQRRGDASSRAGACATTRGLTRTPASRRARASPRRKTPRGRSLPGVLSKAQPDVREDTLRRLSLRRRGEARREPDPPPLS